MRRIGRLRSEASPSKVAVIGQPATAPMTRRQPVPELPKSSAPAGSRKPPTPTPWTRHSPSPMRSTVAPSARMALPVLMHVLAFEQAGNPGLAHRQRAEDQRAVRDRLVAGHAHAALERPAAAGGERSWTAAWLTADLVWMARRPSTATTGASSAARAASRADNPADHLAIDRAVDSPSEAPQFSTRPKEPGPWRNPSSAPSASAAIAARNSTISARPRSSARSATR